MLAYYCVVGCTGGILACSPISQEIHLRTTPGFRMRSVVCSVCAHGR
jgi:hypothetical protein